MKAHAPVRLMLVTALFGLVVVVALGAVTSAPAGNRDPGYTFVDFPGPDEVTFGKNVAYTTSFTNTSGSMYTHVNFSMTTPSTSVNGVPMYASLVYASCEPDGPPYEGLTSTGYSCPTIPQLPSGSDTQFATLVWQTPTVPNPSSLDCDDPGTDCELTTTGTWGIKENQPGSNDTFPTTETTDLLLQPNPMRAGGYAIAPVAGGCTFANANLVTNPSVNSSNKLASAVCASTVPTSTGSPLDPGLVIEITEGAGPGITDSSTICIPAPGESCDDPGYTPWFFSTPATFTFLVDNRSLPPGDKIDTVVHDGEDVTEDCTITIHNPTKTTTVTCTAFEQGRWDMF
jgi:hypothetical protein